MEGKVLSDIATKLGIYSADVVRKATEFARLVTVRGSSLKALGLSGSAKSVICIEIAAACCDIPVDRATTLYVSGMPTKKAYQHAYQALECMLDKQKQFTIHDLAVQFGCLEIAKLAERVLTRYKEQLARQVEADLSKPVFSAAALYTICRKQKIKIDKPKLLTLLGVKRLQFDQLCLKMGKLSDEEFDGDNKSGITKRPPSVLDRLSEAVEENCRAAKKQKQSETTVDETTTDDYEEWKNRILQEAAETNI